MRVTVWKSDYKDFPWLWQAAYYCKDNIVQRAKNFIVFEGWCNPYEVVKYPTIRSGVTYNVFVDFLKRLILSPDEEIRPREKKLLKIIKKRVDNLELNMERTATLIEHALAYPPGHVTRTSMLEDLAYGEE